VLGPAATDARFGFSATADVRFRAVEIAPGARFFSTLRAAAGLRSAIRGADVVHAHGFRAGIVSAIALRRLRALPRSQPPALVVTFHNAMLGSTVRRHVLAFAMRRVARVANAVLVVSPDLAAELASVRADVERALVAGVPRRPAHDPASARESAGLPVDRPLVLAVGRLHSQKGFDVLVRAAPSLQATDIRPVVAIAGGGPERVALSRMIEAAGVDVRLLGDRSDVADLLCAADVVVMPSRWEGWPLAAAEVLAAGRPFIATDVGGLPELVGDAAVLVPPSDPAALAAAVMRVLGDREFADELAARALKRAAELPTNDDVTAQLSSCYQRVLGQVR
jgi:glycosyltransferase involved in cell wall biosynthesis